MRGPGPRLGPGDTGPRTRRGTHPVTRTDPARPVRRKAATIAAALLLATGSAASTLTLPPPAAADEVQTAQQRVERLQSLVTSTAAELTRGTREWEADRKALRRLQGRLRATQARIAQQQLVVDRTTDHVNALARRMYMHPLTVNGLQTALTGTPEAVLGAMRTKASVERVAGSDNQLIREAEQARQALRRQRRLVEQQTAEARRIEARSEKKLAELRALASDMSVRLAAAERSLTGARTRQAARVRAARIRALAAMRGAPACTIRGNAGRPNGMLDPASLCRLWGTSGHALRYDAAQAFNALSRFHQRVKGRQICVTDSYRTYAEQVDVYRRKPALAAVPGTSRHGWGIALDLGCGIQSFGTPAYRWMKTYGPRFGWVHPRWAEPSGSMPEPWHWEFVGR